jgi:hypothetical protein
VSVGIDTTPRDSDCQVSVMISRDHAFTASCTLLHVRSHEGSFLPLQLSLTNAIHAVQLHQECTSHSHTRTVETLKLHSVASQICCTMFEQDCARDGAQCKMLLFKHS